MADTPSQILIKDVWNENPVFRQVLGICSALAVTNLLTNTLFMCLGVIFTLIMSNLTISILRNYIPKRIRMIVQVLIIASYVMMVDIVIKAVSPDIHRFIGPYVGLIITNCIIMGRAEAFASQNRPSLAVIDGLASGIGYSLILIAIALVREPLGFGTIMGYTLPAKEIW
jgi:Na+-transporting NADH:ubiquinone oxidoreductase subunit D